MDRNFGVPGGPLDIEVETAMPLPPIPVWVRNPDLHGGKGIFHVRREPKDGARLRELKTRCGWKFGRSLAVVMDAKPPIARDFYVVCKRCAPWVREEFWAEFADSLKSS